MATVLAQISEKQFRERLESSGCGAVPRRLVGQLYVHYQELRRWAKSLALVGAGEGERIVERHYAESLLAAPLLEEASMVLDLGSGAGFPGFVLAAARPEARFVLFESRGKKAAFLRTVCAKAKLSCSVVDARVSRGHPVTEAVAGGVVDVVTVRGVRIDRETWQGLKPGLAPGARILRWEGVAPVEQWPEARAGRILTLAGRGRRIQEWLYMSESTS